MSHRFRPDPGLQPLATGIAQHLQARAALVDGPWLRGEQSRLARECLRHAFHRCAADEGTVWLLHDGALVPALNSGVQAARLEDTFRQPLDRGIIGMVAVTEQAYCENDVADDTRRDGTLDALLQVQTSAMMAVPFVFGGSVRGVVSCVQFVRSTPRTGFTPSHLDQLEREVHLAGRLLDLALLDGLFGLHDA